MWAMLTAAVPLFTRPANSRMSFGLVPAASTTVGDSIKVGMRVLRGSR
jgi:hypothetical protein